MVASETFPGPLQSLAHVVERVTADRARARGIQIIPTAAGNVTIYPAEVAARFPDGDPSSVGDWLSSALDLLGFELPPASSMTVNP